MNATKTNSARTNNANLGIKKNTNKLNNNTSNRNNNSNNSSNSSIVNKLNNMLNNNKESNNYIYIIIGVLSLVLISGTIYYYYYHVRGKKTFIPEKKEILDSEHDAQTELEVSSGDIPLSKYSNEYGISLWFKVNDYKYRYGEEKVIFRKGPKGSGSPEIVLDAKNNTLIVRTKLQHDNNTQLAKRSSNESFSNVPINNQGLPVNENFSSLNGEETFDNIPKMETFISNNTAPYESQLYEERFFNLISGNNVENFEDNEDTSTTQSSLIRNMTSFCSNLCKLFKLMESKELSKDSFNKIDGMFNVLIEVLELNKSSSTNDKSIVEEKITQKLNEHNKSFSEGETKKLYVLLQRVMVDSMKLNLKGSDINLVELKRKVNDNLKVQECDIRLKGSGSINIEANLSITILRMLKEAMYIKIHNFGKQIEQKYPDLISRTSEPESNQDECRIINLPLQKWTNIVVSQYNQVIDLYLDGHLVSSCVLKGFPLIKEEEAILCPDGGFDGMISRVSIYNTAVTQDAAYEIYKNGGVYSNAWYNKIPTYAYVIIFLVIVGLIGYSMYL